MIATTSRNLQEEVRAGRFRPDLFFALNLLPITCEPLKDRPEDIPYLARHFLDRTTRRLRLPKARLTKANISTLKQYAWPGNVRELENVIERTAILAQGGRLHFDLQVNDGEARRITDRIRTQKELRQLEIENFENALQRSKGKISGQSGAAAILGIAPTTAYSKVKALGIDAAKFG